MKKSWRVTTIKLDIERATYKVNLEFGAVQVSMLVKKKKKEENRSPLQ